MNSSISILEKKKLERDVKKLDKNEYIEILSIIKKNNQNYSQNSTGIFFNLKYINDKTIEEMIHFIEFCKKNKIFLAKKDGDDTKPIVPIPKSKNDAYDNYNIDEFDMTIDIKDFMSSKNNKSNNFTFKNYLDKISVVPKKEFTNKQPDKYPDLININNEFTGSDNRILKKCKNYDNIYSKFIENNNASEYKNNELEAETHI